MNLIKRNNFVVFSGRSTIWLTKLMTQLSRCVYEPQHALCAGFIYLFIYLFVITPSLQRLSSYFVLA